jgi:hypothetical protein
LRSYSGGSTQLYNDLVSSGKTMFYLARVHKPYQIKIEWREIGSDKVHESTR